MKRTLYLVRHAKAEDRTMFQRDHERELVSQGIMAAARVGRNLAEENIHPDCIVSSTAARAKATAKVMAEQLHIDPETIQLNEHLFDGGPKAYLGAINAVDASFSSAMLVGHNPDISYLAEYLTHTDVGSMSTSAVVTIEFDELEWAEISARTGRLVAHISPKKLTKDES
ncbi:SixA phosphatase family protein [Tellurirhabdus bombi]|uniref:SixA phosphatase family protein n=1 Tax=Tellurirhabdus bombi TaxID=2907205 RepID=UPI001F3CF62C|nr:histidine phosphatase family protein [Tellurirhabdus bombi]